MYDVKALVLHLTDVAPILLWLPLFFPVGERHFCVIPSISSRKDAPARKSSFITHVRRFNIRLPYFLPFRFTRWECPMICTILSTICGWKINPLGSFLDKHMPWISGHRQGMNWLFEKTQKCTLKLPYLEFIIVQHVQFLTDFKKEQNLSMNVIFIILASRNFRQGYIYSFLTKVLAWQ